MSLEASSGRLANHKSMPKEPRGSKSARARDFLAGSGKLVLALPEMVIGLQAAFIDMALRSTSILAPLVECKSDADMFTVLNNWERHLAA